MILKNVRIFGEDRRFFRGMIRIENGKFTEILPEESAFVQAEEAVVDGKNCYAIPGLVDIHFHGCAGADICDGTEEALTQMASYEAAEGITSIVPATMTFGEEKLLQIMKTAAAYQKKENQAAHFKGIHLEGPFINREQKGAQAEEHIIPCDVNLYRRLQQASEEMIKIVDVAPEIEGAMEFIEQVKSEVVLSIAHTTADYRTAMEACDKGVTHITHLYNAMPPLHHRNPGVIGAAFAHEKCHVELICDGVHIHPSVVQATLAMFGRERVIFISDSMRATGMPDGDYTLGGQEVHVKGNKAVLTDGTIAGAATNLMDCVRIAVKEMGIPLETAIVCATENPAKEVGIYEECGSICPGKVADMVLLNEDLTLHAVYVAGKLINIRA